jgi:Helix-turn-helix domain
LAEEFDLAVGDAAVFDNRRGSEFHCLDEGETWSLAASGSAASSGPRRRSNDRAAHRGVQSGVEDSGRTFSEHLLERRLERAHRVLRDPRLVYRKISEIAPDAGFSDLSHFNRSFRRRFGETPTQARGMAERRENE